MTKKKNGEMETKRVLDNLRMSKVQEIFTTVSVVCHRYERLTVLPMFSPSFCLERVKVLKNVSKKPHEYKLRQGRKEEAETKRSIWDLKKILEQSRDTMRVCVSVLILFGQCIKQISRLYVAVDLLINRPI